MSGAIATNKKAFRDYTVLERFEAGLELKGSEVKSLRAGRITIDDSFCKVEDFQVALYNTHINPYAQASYLNVEAARPRRLLLHKSQIKHLAQEIDQKSLTIIPLRVYFNDKGIAKMEIGLCKGKKFFDHRDDIKKREIDRKIKQTLKSRNQR
jgi:SsrA-binding protein